MKVQKALGSDRLFEKLAVERGKSKVASSKKGNEHVGNKIKGKKENGTGKKESQINFLLWKSSGSTKNLLQLL